MSTTTILVTGATGNTWSALLRLLGDRHLTVRAMVRNERDVVRLGSTSASIVIGDFDDVGSLEIALKGVDRAYVVTPSSAKAEAQQIRFAELAAAAGVKHLVKLSQYAADEASPVRFLRYHATLNDEFVSLDSAIPSYGQISTSRDYLRSRQPLPISGSSSRRSKMHASVPSMFATSPRWPLMS